MRATITQLSGALARLIVVLAEHDKSASPTINRGPLGFDAHVRTPEVPDFVAVPPLGVAQSRFIGLWMATPLSECTTYLEGPSVVGREAFAGKNRISQQSWNQLADDLIHLCSSFGGDLQHHKGLIDGIAVSAKLDVTTHTLESCG